MRLIRGPSKILRSPVRAGFRVADRERAGDLPDRHVLPLAGFQHHRGEGVWPFLNPEPGRGA